MRRTAFLLVLLFTACAKQQPATLDFAKTLDAVERRMQSIGAIRYTLTDTFKQAKRDDTTVTRYEATLQRIADSTYGYKLAGKNDRGYYVLYDGRQALLGNPDDTAMTLIPAAASPGLRIESTFARILRFPQRDRTTVFENIRTSGNVEQRLAKRVTLDGDSMIVLSVRFKPHDVIAGGRWEMYCRASDYLPVRVTDYLDIREGQATLHQFRSMAISDIVIDPRIDSTQFTAASLPAWARITPMQYKNTGR